MGLLEELDRPTRAEIVRAVTDAKQSRFGAYECAKLALSALEEQIKATALPEVPMNMWKDS